MTLVHPLGIKTCAINRVHNCAHQAGEHFPRLTC